MHKYERYIIYPLLILALFYGMSGGNIIKTVADNRVYEELVAKKITIVDDNGNEIATIKDSKNKYSNTTEGEIRLYEYKNDSEDQEEPVSSNLFNADSFMMGNIRMSGSDGKIILTQFDEITERHNKIILGTIRGHTLSFYGLGIYSTEEELNKQEKFDFKYAFTNKDKNKNIIAGITSVGGNPTVSLFRNQGDNLVSLSTSTKGSGGLWAYDKDGEDSKYFGY